MAESSANKGILIAVVVVALVVWFLFNKASATVKTINTSNKQTYTTGTAVSSAVTNLAPALGSFLSGFGRASTPTYTTAPSSSSYSPFVSQGASASDLAEEGFNTSNYSTQNGFAYTDDSGDFIAG